MTDTFIVDRAGEFVVGKAQTTPEDESAGFIASTRDALAYWGQEPEQAMPLIVSGIYSGTAMINRLLERKGRVIGLIVTAGMEDGLRLERGIQTYLGYPYSDRLHVATHRHNEPLVPRDRDPRRARASRPLRRRGDPALRGRAREAVSELAALGRRGDRREPALQLPQLGARRPNQGDRGRSRPRPAALLLLGALPDAARLPAPELDLDRGLCGRALARAARARARRHARCRARASTCGSWPRTAARSRSRRRSSRAR